MSNPRHRLDLIERQLRPPAAALLPESALLPVAAISQLFGATLDAPGVLEAFWQTFGYAVDPEDRDDALEEAGWFFSFSPSCRPAPYSADWVDYLVRLNADIYHLDAAALRAAGRRIADAGAV